jgi:hypothetical protein
MPTITNTLNLPAAIVAAVTNDPYTSGNSDVSATKLIDAPQVVHLSRQHHDKLTVDVSERIWALLGQAVHTILERAGLREEGMVVEERLYAQVLGWTISGQVDRMHVDAGKLSDYKVTTVYKKHGSDSWTKQLNVLRWLAHQNGHVVDSLEIVAIFRDWRKTDSERQQDYPAAAVQVIPVPVWSLEETEDYIYERVALHQAARKGVDVPCTDQERWYSGTKYALMKVGGKRALRVVDSRDMLEPVGDGQFIQERPGEYKRCQHYCDVRDFCAQWANTKQTGGNDDTVD